MTIISRGNNEFDGLSSDTKPTDVPKNSRFYESDTNLEYVFNGTSWVLLGNGSNTGEANTASYPGTGGIGLTLTKSGANLPFKGISSGASGNVTVTDDTTNKNVVVDLTKFLTYFDMTSVSAPSNPSTGIARLYVKTVDANNDGIFALIKKNGGFVEVQIL